MLTQIEGIHHITSMARDALATDRFITDTLGLRRVKKTVNFDAPDIYHLYYANGSGQPGTVMTYFPFPNIVAGRRGAGEVGATVYAVPEGSLGFWEKRLEEHGVTGLARETRFGETRLLFDGVNGDVPEACLDGALGAGCASNGSDSYSVTSNATVDILALVRETAADLLADTRELDPTKPIVAASFVSIDDLSESSTFGRTLSEMFASSLSRAGLMLIEVKMRNSLFIEEQTGELILSRDIRRLSASHNAQAILLGTYGQGQSMAYVNVRLVRTRDNVVLGASSVQIPLDRNTRAMLPNRW